jgi:hypothetical protein
MGIVRMKEFGMCLVCIDLAKGTLTIKEALRNFSEVVEKMEEEDPKHVKEVLTKLAEKVAANETT